MMMIMMMMMGVSLRFFADVSAVVVDHHAGDFVGHPHEVEHVMTVPLYGFHTTVVVLGLHLAHQL